MTSQSLAEITYAMLNATFDIQIHLKLFSFYIKLIVILS